MLMKKLDKLQNSKQMLNISENISRIRQLIQQARNAASKVGAHTHVHTYTHADKIKRCPLTFHLLPNAPSRWASR